MLGEGHDEPQVLDGAAADVFELLDRPLTLDELVDAVARSHDLAADTVRRPVEASVSLLSDAGLIEVAHARPG